MRSVMLMMLAWALVSVYSGTALGRTDERDGGAISYEDYRLVLSTYVKEGRIDYRALSVDRAKLDRFVGSLAQVDPAALGDLSESERLSFWINAYNALTIRLIVDHYPVASIKEIEGAWDEFNFDVAGGKVSLNEIEHEIIRKRFREPRIHFALVCAAVACPPIRGEPYVGSMLDRQLEEQTRSFLASQYGLLVDEAKGVLHVSPIFDWYGEDFVPSGEAEAGAGRKGGVAGDVAQRASPESRQDDNREAEAPGGVGRESEVAGERAWVREGKDKTEDTPERSILPRERYIIDFIRAHADQATKKRLAGRRWEIRYFDYDWSLNDRVRSVKER